MEISNNLAKAVKQLKAIRSKAVSRPHLQSVLVQVNATETALTASNGFMLARVSHAGNFGLPSGDYLERDGVLTPGREGVPKYEQHFPLACALQYNWTLPTSAVGDLLAALSLFDVPWLDLSTDNGKDLALRYHHGCVSLTVVIPQLLDASPGATIRVNPAYLVAVLKLYQTTVTLRLSDPNDPLLVESGPVRAVIMPMRADRKASK